MDDGVSSPSFSTSSCISLQCDERISFGRVFLNMTQNNVAKSPKEARTFAQPNLPNLKVSEMSRAIHDANLISSHPCWSPVHLAAAKPAALSGLRFGASATKTASKVTNQVDSAEVRTLIQSLREIACSTLTVLTLRRPRWHSGL